LRATRMIATNNKRKTPKATPNISRGIMAAAAKADELLRDELKQFFSMLVGNYIHYPDELYVEVGAMAGGLAVRITPKEFDYGKVSGRGGENIQALTCIGAAIAINKSVPLRVMLLGPSVKPAKGPEIPYVVDRLWTKDRIKPIITQVLIMAGKEHLQVLMRKNPDVPGEYFYVIEGFRDESEREFGGALGRLMTAIGRTQGVQLITPAEDRRAKQP
jgi:predicted RNA-binding protein YlqC (UPF0109 family)